MYFTTTHRRCLFRLKKMISKYKLMIGILLTPSLIIIYQLYYGSLFAREPRLSVDGLTDKYFVYSCRRGMMCGGWGDRQKGIIAVYLMANATNSKFGIEIEKPCDFTSALQPKSFNWILNKDKFINRSSERREIIDGQGRELRDKFTKDNITEHFPQDVSYLTINSKFSHYIRQNKLYSQNLAWLKRLSMAETFATIWRDIMELSPELQKRYQQFVETRVAGKKLICAQIRIGRDPNNADFRDDFPVMDLAKISQVWNLFQKYNDPEKYRIFLTTDNQQVRTEATKLFPEMFIETDGPIGHVDKGPETDKTCDAFKKVILDQHILSTCDVLVTSYSGIGRHAAYVRRKETYLYCFLKDRDLSPCNFNSSLFQPSNW
ncbi:uncharacterized protein LOC126814279 [Patella vulgata]|uniref:uncharacterized protein LOC126814279 n=1 Tax=Patella vulgata TaxID=6465 RepID=UPI0024A86A7F|nr:uncharacterized protein LOC126814279 [Patella vulgata]